MAFVCFNCALVFGNIPDIVRHYRYLHRIGPLDKCFCKQPGCHRFFDTLDSLEHHLYSHINDVVGNVDNLQQDMERDDIVIFDVEMGENEIPIEGPLGNGIVNDENNAALNAPPVTLENFVSVVSSSALSLVAKLYADPTLPRSHVQKIIDYSSTFLASGYLPLLREKVCSLLTADQVVEVEGFFKILENPFSGLETEHARFKAFREDKFLIEPEPFEAAVIDAVQNVDGHAQLVPKSSEGYFLPMRHVLKNFLELPGVFDSICNYVHEVEGNFDCLKDYFQSENWANTKAQFEGKTVFPIFLHGDGYDPDNINGSHAGDHGLEPLYFTLPGIPKEYQASLKNMFIAFLSLTKDKKSGNNVIYDRVLDELDYLSTEGITINSENGDQHVYFALALVLGDNKGIHEMLGFMPGFSANYFCRICKTHKNITHTQVIENIHVLRTVENYNDDLVLNTPRVTGINEECVFNTIAGYHCISNPSVDIMHDMLEGVCKYGFAHCIFYFATVRQYFSLEDFRDILKTFDFGILEGNNRPPFSKFTDDRVQQKSISLSASEMLCIVRYLGLLIGHFIPENDDVWQYFLKLQEILDFLMSPVFYPGWVVYLQAITQEHHEMYLRLFNDTLKPKHHMMLHYPRLIQMHGPPVHIWSMFCERKHRISKQYARVCLNRINLPYTIMLKHSLELCLIFLSGEGFHKHIVITGDILYFGQICYYNDIQHFVNYGRNSLCSVSLKSVCVHGTKYHNGSVVLYSVDNDFPIFGVIKMFIAFDPTEVYFVLEKLVTEEKNVHINSYSVLDSTELICVKQSDVLSFQPLHKRVYNGKFYVTLRHAV